MEVLLGFMEKSLIGYTSERQIELIYLVERGKKGLEFMIWIKKINDQEQKNMLLVKGILLSKLVILFNFFIPMR